MKIPWQYIYEKVNNSKESLGGYYNKNYPVQIEGDEILLRVPILDAKRMDLHVLDEVQVMQLAREADIYLPPVIYENKLPAFQIHEYVQGPSLEKLSPPGSRVPLETIEQIVESIAKLQTILKPPKDLPSNWPPDKDTVGFANKLIDHTEQVYQTHLSQFGELFSQLGVSASPVETIKSKFSQLTERPFRLMHCDLHRKNILLTDKGICILDWELSLWGDPVYEIATHLHKLDYQRERIKKSFSPF